MSWGIWKKIKQGVAKVGGFVKNLLGGAPKAINNAVDTVNSIGKKAMKGVKRASKIVQRFQDSDDQRFALPARYAGDEPDEESEEEEEAETLPKIKPKLKPKAKQVPKWRKLLERREASSDDEPMRSSKYAVNYAGRSWLPKMKFKTRRSAIDDSEDLSE